MLQTSVGPSPARPSPACTRGSSGRMPAAAWTDGILGDKHVCKLAGWRKHPERAGQARAGTKPSEVGVITDSPQHKRILADAHSTRLGTVISQEAAADSSSGSHRSMWCTGGPDPFPGAVCTGVDAALRLAHQLLAYQASRVQRHVCANARQGLKYMHMLLAVKPTSAQLPHAHGFH